MNPTNETKPLSIADEAEFESWRNVRNEVRRRLTASVTFAFVYIVAALAVGGCLLVVVRDVCENAVYLDNWDPVEYDVRWMTQVAWGYAGATIIAVLLFPLALLLIHHRLPAGLNRFMNLVPWIGSTMRIVSLADFFQSMYHSVLKSQSYARAMAEAGGNVRAADMRGWAAESARRIDAGQSVTDALALSPVRESPILAMSVLVDNASTDQQTRQIWHHASAECHALAMSRLTRTNQFLSISCLIVCVLLASFALLVSAMYLALALKSISFNSDFLWGLL